MNAVQVRFEHRVLIALALALLAAVSYIHHRAHVRLETATDPIAALYGDVVEQLAHVGISAGVVLLLVVGWCVRTDQ